MFLLLTVFPSNSMEAYLLLESACANHQLWLTCQSLALQSIHQNTLKLQYNQLTLERVQKGLCNTNKAISHIRFLIHQSSVPISFEYTITLLLCTVRPFTLQ